MLNSGQKDILDKNMPRMESVSFLSNHANRDYINTGAYFQLHVR